MIGIQIDHDSFNNDAGNTVLALHRALQNVEQIKRWVDANGTASLEALGFTPTEAAAIASTFTDLDQLRSIYEGSQALAAAKDFRTFARQMYGLGI